MHLKDFIPSVQTALSFICHPKNHILHITALLTAKLEKTGKNFLLKHAKRTQGDQSQYFPRWCNRKKRMKHDWQRFSTPIYINRKRFLCFSRPQNMTNMGKKNHITSLLDLKGKCMIGNYSSRSCAQECGGRTRTMTMLSAQIFHRPETESINFSTTQEQMPRTQWDLGRSEASSKLQAL